MKVAVALGIAAIAFAGARVARESAAERDVERTTRPYSPSPAAAPFLSLGYRELAADVLYVRMRSYFGGYDHDADSVGSLAEAIIALDPSFGRVYEYGARAMTMARRGVDQAAYLRAIAILERGIREFPNDWRLPFLAGQIYTQDLQTTDPAQRRAWDETGTLLVESAIRKPGAPAQAAEWAAVMRTKFGQYDRAVQGLREILLITDDAKARKALLERLAKLQEDSSDSLAAEVEDLRKRFEKAWKRDRPAVPATWYVVLGPRLQPGFDLATLATGGRDLVGTEQPHEALEPLD